MLSHIEPSQGIEPQSKASKAPILAVVRRGYHGTQEPI
jgi:hypothetical protein